MYTLRQIPAGTIITIRAWDGTEAHGTVTAHGENKGRACVDFTDSEGGSRWAYLDQVTGIYAAPRSVSLATLEAAGAIAPCTHGYGNAWCPICDG